MGRHLPRRGNESSWVEQEAKRDRFGCLGIGTGEPVELGEAFDELRDPDRDRHVAAAELAPRSRNGTLDEVGEQGPQIVRLPSLAVANLDESFKFGADERKERPGDASFAIVESTERGHLPAGLRRWWFL